MQSLLSFLLTLALCAISALPAHASEPTASPAALNAEKIGYAVRAGDLLHVSVWKEDQLDRDTLVLPDGTIDFPLIGSVKAEGKTTAALQAEITKLLTPFVRNASVSVYVKETRGNTVSIMGQVAHPGDIVMSRPLNVMQALSQAGGLTAYAGSGIKILRKVDGKDTTLDFDYSDVSAGHDLETNITLQPGDVVVVPTASLF